MFIASDFCVLTFEFYVVGFPPLIFVLCVFGTVIFLLEGSIKRSKANLQISGMRKNECREIKKTGMRIILYFMQF